jgi:hypothetical protein
MDFRPSPVRSTANPAAKVAIAVAAVVVVAGVGISLLPAGDGVAKSGDAVSPLPSTSPAPFPSSPAIAPSPAVTMGPNREYSAIDPGGYEIPRPHMRIHLTMPAGWLSTDAGTTITRRPLDGPGPTLTLDVHDVTHVATDVCPRDPSFVKVGPTAEDVTTALVNQVGTRSRGPTAVMLGGFAARKIELALPADFPVSCGGPEGRRIWADATTTETYFFGLLDGGTATMYVVDVHGDRLVITSQDRGAAAEDMAQLDAIIASIDIEPLPSLAESLPVGRQSLTVDGIPFSFSVPAPAQGARWARYGTLYISKDSEGPPTTEAVIYWTRFPDGVYAPPCANLMSPHVGSSAADLAAAVSTAPGTELVTGPSDATVGGRAAKYVVLTVREDNGCNPGFFRTSPGDMGSAPWAITDVGATIRVWIVVVDGRRLFIAGETTQDAAPELDQEIQQIVGSIRFG